MTTQTVQGFFSRLHIGIDVDWCKTGDARAAYSDHRVAGISLPQAFKQRGFDHVRIRVKDYDLFGTDPKLGTKLITEIEYCVLDCAAAGILPIVSFQAQNYKTTPNTETLTEVAAWWQAVALVLKGTDCAFNLLIESTDAVRNNSKALNDLYRECAKVIGEADPDRVMVVCPAGISSPYELRNLIVPENAFAEAHFNAAGFSRAKGTWTTGTTEEKATVKARLNEMMVWATEAKTPVWLGAIMFGNFNGDPSGSENLVYDYTVEQQVEIARFVKAEAQARGIPFAINSCDKYWDYIGRCWRPEMSPVLDALLA
jgi:Cellulase (glycosyl hydrolase family 5)